MDNDSRVAEIEVGGQKYELLLTTKAAKEIGQRYGGLANLGERLANSENFEEIITEFVWLLTLFANQSILRHNLLNSDKKELLTEDAVELLTNPSDFSDYKDAILLAMYRGARREVESEEEISQSEKNLTDV